jgi:hypothetical protein
MIVLMILPRQRQPKATHDHVALKEILLNKIAVHEA